MKEEITGTKTSANDEAGIQVQEISQEQQLLHEKFKLELEQNAPFGEDGFNPEAELKAISTSSKKDKGDALERFKKRRKKYKRALSTTYEFLSRSIKDNPEINKNILLFWLHKFAQNYSFSEEVIQEYTQSIEKYYKHRQGLKDLIKQYGDSMFSLVEALTGYRVPEDEKHQIEEVKLGIFSIDIICNGSTLIVHKLMKSIYQEHKYVPHQSYAVYESKLGPDFPLTVIGSTWWNQESTINHEHQHHETAFMRKFFYCKPELAVQWSEYIDEKNPKKRRKILESYMKQCRDIALEKFKSEFFSMIADGTLYGYHPEKVFHVQGGSYDYLGYLRNYRKNDPDFMFSSKKILSNEYYEIVDKAVHTFTVLSWRMSKKAIMGLFHTVPVRKWPKEAKRYLLNDSLKNRV